MTDLFKELETDLRQEKFDRLWQRFGRAMVLASVAVVLATVVHVAWKEHRKTQAAEQTGALLAAVEKLNAGDYADATKDFEAIAASADDAHATLALLRKAQAEKNAGDLAAAAATYTALANREGPLAFLAKVSAGGAEPQPGEPFYYTRSENHAWSLLEQNRHEEALALLTRLRDDPNAPRAQRMRLAQTVPHIPAGAKHE